MVMATNNWLRRTDDEQISAILEALTPRRTDPTFSVLKAHLLVEEFLTEYLATKVTAARHLQNARLSFSQKLALARSMSPRHDDEFTWDRLAKLNSLRNELAHKRDPAAAAEKIEAFVSEAKRLAPMPEPAARVSASSPMPAGGPWYTDLDMALMVICSLAALALGLDLAGRLPPLSETE
jgi:hypothetical protein